MLDITPGLKNDGQNKNFSTISVVNSKAVI